MRHEQRQLGREVLAGLLLCFVVVSGFSGCGVQNDVPSEIPTQPKIDGTPNDGQARPPGDVAGGPTYRGHLVWGHEARSFVECDARREGWVVDATGGDLPDVYQELTSEPYQPLFVGVRGRWQPAPREGFGADYVEQIEVVELRRAARESKGCAEDLAGIDYVASGNEPFWRVEIRKTGILFSALGRFDQIEFPRPSVATTSTATVFTAEREGQHPDRIEIEVTESRCADSMSGSRFSYAAIVRLDDSTFEGCALAGW